MDPIIVGELVKLAKDAIKSFFPETSEEKLAAIELSLRGQAMDNELLKGQQAINLEDAKSESLFKSGWRPCVGWVCTFGLAYQTLGLALIKTLLALLVIVGVNPDTIEQVITLMPDMDTATLVSLLFNLLGITTVGAMRTVERIKGVKS